MRVVFERWYGQGDEIGGLRRRARIDPCCEMSVWPSGRCGKPATERYVDPPGRRYPSAKYWCPEHAAYLRDAPVQP